MAFSDRVLSGLKLLAIASDNLKSLKSQAAAFDARERELRDRVTYIEGMLAAVGAPPKRLRLPNP